MYTVEHIERNPIKYYQCTDCGAIKTRSGQECRMLRDTGALPEPKMCLPCQTSPRNWKHGTGNAYYYHRCRCDKCRGYAAEQWQKQEARRVKETGSGYRRQYPGICALPRCSKPFVSNSRSEYCSRAHGAEGWQARERYSRTLPVIFDKEFAKYQQLRLDAGFHEIPHERRGGRWISDERRQEIYERDNYTCAICNESCKRNAARYDPLSLTLDHVLPWSNAETWNLLHDDFNLRTTHRSCNMVRQAKWISAEWLSLMVITEDVSVDEARSVRAAL